MRKKNAKNETHYVVCLLLKLTNQASMSYIQSVDKTVTVQKNFCIFYLFIFTPALAEAAGQASRSSNLFWPGFPKLSDKSYLTSAQPTIVCSTLHC
jgi:hypothetical protein